MSKVVVIVDLRDVPFAKADLSAVVRPDRPLESVVLLVDEWDAEGYVRLVHGRCDVLVWSTPSNPLSADPETLLALARAGHVPGREKKE